MKRSVNLLSWNYRRRQLIRRRLLQWSAAAAVLGSVAAGWVAAALVQQAEVRQIVADLEAQYAPIAELTRQLTEARKTLRQWEDRRKAAAALEETRPALTLLGLVSRCARACQGRLRIDQLALQPLQAVPGADRRKSSPGSQQALEATGSNNSPSATVTIKGQALDNLAVAQFVASLRETRAFEKVELKSTAQAASETAVRSYLVECTY